MTYKWKHPELIFAPRIIRKSWTIAQWNDAYDDLYGYLESGVDWGSTEQLRQKLSGLENNPKKAQGTLYDFEDFLDRYKESEVFAGRKINRKKGLRKVIEKREADIRERIKEQINSRFDEVSKEIAEWELRHKKGERFDKEEGRWLSPTDFKVIKKSRVIKKQEEEFEREEKKRIKSRAAELPKFLRGLGESSTISSLREFRRNIEKNKVLSSSQVKDLIAKSFSKEASIVQQENERRSREGLKRIPLPSERARSEITQPTFLKTTEKSKLDRFKKIDLAEIDLRKGIIDRLEFERIKNVEVSKVEELEREIAEPSRRELDSAVDFAVNYNIFAKPKSDSAKDKERAGKESNKIAESIKGLRYTSLPPAIRDKLKPYIVLPTKNVAAEALEFSNSQLKLRGFTDREIEEARSYWRKQIR